MSSKTRPDKRGKSFFNIELEPRLRHKLVRAAMKEGKTLKQWFPEFIEHHVPDYELVPRHAS